MMAIRTIAAIFPISTRPDGVPRQSVSSASGAPAGAAGGAKPAGEGLPQCGQAAGSVETSRPQSGQVTTGMGGIVATTTAPTRQAQRNGAAALRPLLHPPHGTVT